MKKRLLVLAVLAVGVWAVIHFWPAELTLEVDPNWPHFNLADVNSVEFNTRHGMHSAERRGTEFVIHHNGVEYPALSGKIVEIINYINNYKPTKKLEGISDEKHIGFGLDNPSPRFTVFAKDRTWTISMGDQNPPKTGYFATYSDSNDIVIVPTGFHEKFGRRYDLFVEKMVFRVDEQRVSKLRVTGPGTENFTIGVRKGVYTILEPESLSKMALDQKEAKDYVHTVITMIGDKFLEEGLPEMPPMDSRFEVSLLGQEEPLILSVHKVPDGAPSIKPDGEADSAEDDKDKKKKKGDDGRYVAESTQLPVPFTIKEVNLKRMYIDPKKLRSKSVVNFDASSLGRMVFHKETGEGKMPLTVLRSGRDWLEVKSNKPVAGLNVLLWRLSDLKYSADPVQEVGDTATRSLLERPALRGKRSAAPATSAVPAPRLTAPQMRWRRARPR